MIISQLLYLRELVETGNFTDAARKLGISQPALSIQIKKLEEEVELALIDRNSRPIQLTADGEKFFEISVDILNKFEILNDFSFRKGDDINGELKIGIIPTLAPYFVSLFISEIESRYPDLHLGIYELITEEIIHRIKAGYLDAGIISTPVEMKRMQAKPLFYEKFFLYVSGDHSLAGKKEISLEEIDFDRVWYLQEGNCFRNQVNSICGRAGNRVPGRNLVYFSNSIESMRRIVESEGGITFLPELATILIPSEQEDFVKEISGKGAYREISMVYSSVYSKKNLLQAFTQVTLDQIPPRMKKKPEAWVVDTMLKIEQ